MDMPTTVTQHSQHGVNAKNCGNLGIPQKILQFRTINLSPGPFYGRLGPFNK